MNCAERFTPDARNAHHQRYCTAPACKAASKRASQAKWLAKPENQDYHRGPDAVTRVRAWRQAHPGYSRRKAGVTLGGEFGSGVSPSATTCNPCVATAPAGLSRQISCNASEPARAAPLQDLLNAQPPVLVGLIAHIWGSALQEDIASALNRLLQLGQDIRGGAS
jgi:hypothetical protein